MKISITILCFFSVGIYTTVCMEQEPLKQFRDLNWKKDIRILTKITNIPKEEYDSAVNDILNYAVDQYERKTNVTLSTEERESMKTKLLRRTLKKSVV